MLRKFITIRYMLITNVTNSILKRESIAIRHDVLRYTRRW